MSTTATSTLTLDLRDPLLDLKLAVWQTQLEEVYPGAIFTCRFDHMRLQAELVIEFDNVDEQMHWQLSSSFPIVDPHNWLTYEPMLLKCSNEQKNHILQH